MEDGGGEGIEGGGAASLLSLLGLLEMLKGKCRKRKCGITPHLAGVQTALLHPAHGDADLSSLRNFTLSVAVLRHHGTMVESLGPGARPLLLKVRSRY